MIYCEVATPFMSFVSYRRSSRATTALVLSVIFFGLRSVCSLWRPMNVPRTVISGGLHSSLTRHWSHRLSYVYVYMREKMGNVESVNVRASRRRQAYTECDIHRNRCVDLRHCCTTRMELLLSMPFESMHVMRSHAMVYIYASASFAATLCRATCSRRLRNDAIGNGHNRACNQQTSAGRGARVRCAMWQIKRIQPRSQLQPVGQLDHFTATIHDGALLALWSLS